MVVEAEELLPNLAGAVIVNGELGEDGLHLNLADGRILIFAGAFIVSLYEGGRVLQ